MKCEPITDFGFAMAATRAGLRARITFLAFTARRTLAIPLFASEAAAQVCGTSNYNQSCPPPTTGTYAYNSFVLANTIGASYVDPVFGATVRRVALGTRDLQFEHLAADGKLSPVQEAFLEAGATQCGFCTPGFVLMTKQLLEHNPLPSDDDIRDYLAGNLCRCAAYPEIIEAVKAAARQRESAHAKGGST